MAVVGYITLILALLASVYSVLTYAWGAKTGQRALIENGRKGLLATCGLVSIAAVILVFALVTHDFSLEYVASYTSRSMSFVYLLSAFWAGNNGSLLFWAWILSLCAVVMVLQKRDTGKELVPYAAAIVMFTEAFFLLLIILVSNPFRRQLIVPADGSGLNPMLENPGMIFHPPALLAGYVGLTIPFALAVAALMSRKLDSDWTLTVRRWTLLSWLLLGVGNIIGAWWAYVELGWGGYWAWDPVENAGLMPWLVATAFLHSSIAQRRKGILKVWNMALIILAFNLAIFGTFLTRSGILSSVHTFGESRLGPFFVVFIGITLLGSLALLYHRKDDLKSEEEIESLVSRESSFLLNNLLLVGSTFAIFLGTVFPAISEAIRGVKVTVGPPFFNLINAPVFLAIILLAGLCTLIGWQRPSLRKLAGKFLWPLVAAFILGLVLFITGMRQGYAIIAFSLCAFVLFGILFEWFRETRERHQARMGNYLKAFWNLTWANRRRYGGYVVHIAIVLMAVGITGSSLFDVQKEVTLKPGEAMTINNYVLTFDDMSNRETRDKLVVTARLTAYDGEKPLGQLTPEKTFHRSYEQPVTEVAIRSTPVEDLYVIMAGWEQDGTVALEVLVNPLVSWLWVGGVLLSLGGVVAFWPERRRQPAPRAVSVLEKSAKIDEEIEERVRELRGRKGRSCSQCGAEHREDDRFCPRCGANLRGRGRS
ncbi:MAG: cytochrome c biogenesis protein CcsA [Chloroflexi bacterium]|nr:cytochrome c biogenesis protein CcsA [Chloroflexota bacterium]